MRDAANLTCVAIEIPAAHANLRNRTVDQVDVLTQRILLNVQLQLRRNKLSFSQT